VVQVQGATATHYKVLVFDYQSSKRNIERMLSPIKYIVWHIHRKWRHHNHKLSVQESGIQLLASSTSC